MRPTASTFLAALMSRSCRTPQAGHTTLARVQAQGVEHMAAGRAPLGTRIPPLTLRRGYSPTDARFTTAATATAPRRAGPARTIVLAAFSSRSSTSLQWGPTGVRTERRLGRRSPQPLPCWLGNAGGTATTRRPAAAAWPSRRVRNAAPPAALLLLASTPGERVAANPGGHAHIVPGAAVVVAPQPQGRRVGAVAPLPPPLLLGLPGEPARVLTAFAPVRAARAALLGGGAAGRCPAGGARGRDPVAVRGAEQARQPPVSPGLAAGGGQRRSRSLRPGAADGPASHLPHEGDRLARAHHATGPAHRDPPDLGADQDSLIQRGAVAVLLPSSWSGQAGERPRPGKRGQPA